MATMKQWIAWAERQVGQAVVGEGLRVGLAGVIQGPLTVTFRLRLLRPTPADLRKLLEFDEPPSEPVFAAVADWCSKAVDVREAAVVARERVLMRLADEGLKAIGAILP